MTRPARPVEIDMSGIPVVGVGGLGLVAVAVMMSLVLPAAWWLLVIGATGGVIVGAALVLLRSRDNALHPGNGDPRILLRIEHRHANVPGTIPREAGQDREQLVLAGA